MSEKDRELCINMTALSGGNVGITLACAFILFMDNTFLKHK